jgi:hypothetical protein
MVYLPCHLSSFLSSSLSNSTDDDAAFAHFSPRRFFLGVEMRPEVGAMKAIARKKFPATGIGVLGTSISCDPKPNNMIILIKHDNYTGSVTFLCIFSSFLPLYRTSGALPERLESLRSAEGPSRAHGRLCSFALPSGATDCQPLKPALQARLSSGCRRR